MPMYPKFNHFPNIVKISYKEIRSLKSYFQVLILSVSEAYV